MTINILGVTHKVIEKTIPTEPFFMGKWVEHTQEIWVNSDLMDDTKNLTMWHEAVHALLCAIGEPELSSNEGFVERLSRALFQTATLRIDNVVD